MILIVILSRGNSVVFKFPDSFVLHKKNNTQELNVKGIRPLEISPNYFISSQFLKTCFGWVTGL